MKRKIFALVAAGLTSSFAIGCQNDKYDPKASDTQLSAYAGQASYPYSMHADGAMHLFAVVAADDTITLYNADDQPLGDFELWVNKVYTLHVDKGKLAGRSSLPINPSQLFNKSGSNLGGVPANTITSVQVFMDGKLMDVQGPILPH